MATRNRSGIGRSLSENAPEIAGGMVGVGAPVALREFADTEVGSIVPDQGDMAARLTRPSVLYGVGGGLLSGALWWTDMGPDMLDGFLLAHTITALPTGIASAALPPGANGNGNGSAAAARRRSGRTRPARTDGGNEFDDADGTADEFGESS